MFSAARTSTLLPMSLCLGCGLLDTRSHGTLNELCQPDAQGDGSVWLATPLPRATAGEGVDLRGTASWSDSPVVSIDILGVPAKSAGPNLRRWTATIPAEVVTQLVDESGVVEIDAVALDSCGREVEVDCAPFDGVERVWSACNSLVVTPDDTSTDEGDDTAAADDSDSGGQVVGGP